MKTITNKPLTEIESNFWAVENLPKGDYDDQAVKYDKLISNSIYNKIMWGNSPKNYAQFLNEALANHKEGIIADIGCGTLGFTAKEYAKTTNKEIILSDLSYGMLKIGKDRLEKLGTNNSNIKFLRADAFDLPFKEESISSVFSFGILHVFEKREELLKEFYRICAKNGQLKLTSLCTDRAFSEKYLNMLHKKGHVSKPLNSNKITELVEKTGFKITNKKTIGGMTYISATK